MKIRFSASEYLLAAVLVAVVAYATGWGTEAMRALQALFPRTAQSTEPPAHGPRAVVPLAKQIPACRREGPGFQACMFRAGYAVNSAWTAAHDKDAKAGAAPNPERAGDVINDQYRVGPSPAYGVPYWAPRE